MLRRPLGGVATRLAGQHALDDIVLAHGNAARKQQQIGVEPLLNHRSRGFVSIARDTQNPRHSARAALGLSMGGLGVPTREVWVFRYKGGFMECKLQSDTGDSLEPPEVRERSYGLLVRP